MYRHGLCGQKKYLSFIWYNNSLRSERGEIIGLKWRDLNLQTGELRITRQVVKTGSSKEISVPKTKSSVHTILLPPDMVELLAELIKTMKAEIADMKKAANA